MNIIIFLYSPLPTKNSWHPSSLPLSNGINHFPYSFNSPSCNKEFTQMPSLQKHIRVHTGAKPYICDFEGCGKAFSQVCFSFTYSP